MASGVLRVSTDGWHVVIRHWDKWACADNHWLPPQVVRVHATREAAQAHADRLNTPRPAPQCGQQDALFETKEA